MLALRCPAMSYRPLAPLWLWALPHAAILPLYLPELCGLVLGLVEMAERERVASVALGQPPAFPLVRPLALLFGERDLMQIESVCGLSLPLLSSRPPVLALGLCFG